MKISPQVADTLSGWAEQYYNPDLPYHNWGHAEEVIDESLTLLNTNGRWTRHVNRPLLQIAAAWHDAGHDHDERHAFESPEHYSAYLMRERLKGQLALRQLSEVEESILGTRYKKPRDTMAAIALHYGDVGNMAHDFDDFWEHTLRLWGEYGKPEWETFVANARGVIATTGYEAIDDLLRIGIYDGEYTRAVFGNMYQLIVSEEQH